MLDQSHSADKIHQPIHAIIKRSEFTKQLSRIHRAEFTMDRDHQHQSKVTYVLKIMDDMFEKRKVNM